MASNPLMPPGGAQGLVAAAGPAMMGGGGDGGGGLQQLASQGPNASGGPMGMQPPGAGADAPQAPGQRPNSASGELMAQHDYAKSVFESVTRARNILDHIRREMDQLTQKGDTVSPQDVMAAAGRVVGHGAAAKEMAVILSDMPPMGGQALAGWLQMHDASVRQQEAHADMLVKLTGNRMAAAAFRSLAADHIANRNNQIQAARARMGVLSPGGRVGMATGPGRALRGEPGQGTPMMAMNNPLAPQGGGAG